MADGPTRTKAKELSEHLGLVFITVTSLAASRAWKREWKRHGKPGARQSTMSRCARRPSFMDTAERSVRMD